MRVLRLNTRSIGTIEQLQQSLDALTNFPGWYGPKLDDWLDLVSYFDRRNHAPNSYSGEFYCLEVSEAELFAIGRPQLFILLSRWVAMVNKRAVARGGSPLMALIPLAP